MRRRKVRRSPSGSPVFPFHLNGGVESKPTPSSSAPLSASKGLIVRQPSEQGKITETLVSFGDREEGGRPRRHYYEQKGPYFHDQRILHIEEKDGRWVVAAAWKAEGFGELPAIMKMVGKNPDVFSRIANGLLYDLDPLIGRIFKLTRLLGCGSRDEKGQVLGEDIL